ncbi:MAG: FeoA family protein [Promethearchaeota archaeon]
MTNIKLKDMKVGQSAIVVKISGEHSRRFAEMGIVKGTSVKLIRMAPLGDPLEIRVKNYNLSLRKSDAEHITVKVED